MAKKKIKKMQKKIKVPVVTILGHVDHGKTSILDAIRSTSVQEKEEGGITQYIRAHSFEYEGRKVTFVDTPGHEAFTQMRVRGGDVADVGILVVAADDSVKPQTKEAIEILKQNKIPFIVAINKIDKKGADVEKVKRDLATEKVLVEGYGGDIPCVEVSAKEKKNLDKLMEMVFLVADMKELTMEEVDYGRATILESKQEKGLGNIALVIVREGKFKQGQFVATTKGISKIRTLLDEFNKQQKTLEAGYPGLVVGLSEVLPVGEVIFSVNNREEGRKILELFKQQLAQKLGEEEPEEEVSESEIAAFFKQTQKRTDVKELPIVIKADTKGTLEVVTQSINDLSTDQVEVKIIKAEVGNITEKDVELASVSHAIIISFNTDVDQSAEKLAKDKKVFIQSYKIIYKLIEEVSEAIESLAKPEKEEKIIGEGKVVARFDLSNGTIIAGTLIEEGEFKKNKKCYIVREGKRVAEGTIISMKHEKEEISVLAKGFEVGLNIKPQFDIQVGDRITCFVLE